MDFDFISGKFEKLRVVKAFHFGPIQHDLRLGQTVEFDGNTVRLGTKDHEAPQLFAALRAGWLVMEGAPAGDVSPKPAGVQVRPAQSTGNERGGAVVMEPASQEERVVGTVFGTKAKTEAARVNAARANGAFDAVDEAPVAVVQARDSSPVEVTYPGVGNTPPLGKKFPTVQDDGAGQGGTMIRTAAKNDVQFNEAPSSEGVAVAKIATATKQHVVLTDMAQAAAQIDKLDNTPPPKAKKFASMDAPSSEGVVVAKVGAAVKRPVVTDSAAAAREASRLDSVPPPKAKKFATVAEGEDIRATLPGGATGDVAKTRAGDDLASLLPDAAVAGLPATVPFTWDTTKGYWGNRVKEAVAKYSTNPVMLEKIIALEGPKIGAHIRAAVGKK